LRREDKGFKYHNIKAKDVTNKRICVKCKKDFVPELRLIAPMLTLTHCPECADKEFDKWLNKWLKRRI